MADMGKKTSKYSTDFSFMQSVASTGLKHKDPNALLHSMPLPQKYKEEMGPDPKMMQKLQKEQAKKEAAAKKLLKEQPELKDRESIKESKRLEELANEISQLPTQIYQDDQGRIRDKEGYNRQGAQTSSLDINRAKQRESKIKQLLKIKKDAEQNEDKPGAFFDQSLKSTNNKRDKRMVSALQFITKGAIVEKAEQLRTEINIKKRAPEKDEEAQGLYKKLSQVVQKSGVRTTTSKVKHRSIIPEVEWWDRAILKEDQTFYLPSSMLNDLIIDGEYSLEDLQSIDQDRVWNNPKFHKKMVDILKKTKFNKNNLSDKLFTVSTPIDQATLTEMFKPKVAQAKLETRLTKEEKKKQARERKREYQKDLQEKIKYGIVKAPEPKLKLATFMRTLANEAVQDPTKVEMEVKKHIEERQQKHVERNEARKLTKEQKREKMLKKLKKDSSKECKVCIFNLKTLHDFKIRAKVRSNAEQLQLNGFCLMPSKEAPEHLPVVLVIEGGPKYIKFFKNLLMRRIDWTAKRGKKQEATNESISDELEDPGEGNEHCSLVWEGIITDHIFPKWTIKEVHNELEARRHFADRGVEEYWEMVLNKARRS